MIRSAKIYLLTMGALALLTVLSPALAADTVLTRVKVIHAATGSAHIDPGLKDISQELKSVFRYTAYRLVNETQMTLAVDQEGKVALPGKRTLTVIPVNLTGKRIQYRIQIRKNKKKIFQTQVQLKNNRSITIGGPKFNKGVLIFNISGQKN